MITCCINSVLFFWAVQNYLGYNLSGMIDSMFTAQGQESYYFQLIPIGLTIINRESDLPSQGTTYRFSIFKGQQKFDQNKVPIQAKFEQSNGDLPTMAINSCRLNFYLPSYNRVRKQQFILKLIQHQHNQDYEIGDYSIDANSLILQYREKAVLRHELKNIFSDDYELEFEIYVDKSRIAVEKNVKELKQERINKSPSKDRRESPKKNAQISKTEQQETPSRDQQVPKKEVPLEKNPVSATASVKQSRNKSPPKVEKIQKIDKNDAISQKQSERKVPIIQTKYKAVSKFDAKSEIHMAESQRLSSQPVTEVHAHSSNGDPTQLKQKLLLWGFLVVGAIVMYFSMHPNSKV